MTTIESDKKKTGHFSPTELQTLRDLIDPEHPSYGIELAAQKLNREPQSVTTRYYKLKRADAAAKSTKKHEQEQPNGKSAERKSNSTHYPSRNNGNENRESIALQGIKSLIPKLTTQERISAIQNLAEA